MTKYILSLILLTLVAASCSNDSDPVADKSNFTKIYDNNKFSASYYPIDIKQTPDGGFLILGGKRLDDSNFSGTYILKTDEFGNFISDNETAATDLVNPLGLLESSAKYYFFAMTPLNQNVRLTELNIDGTINTPMIVNGNYPSASSVDGSNFILLSYNNGDKKSVLSIVSPTGTTVKTQSFDIGAGDDHTDEVITNHFTRTGRQIPFFVGKNSASQYYFNGFYNYTLSLIFTDLNSDQPQGEIQGVHDDGGISQLMPLGSGKFAISRFNFGDNYFAPNAALPTSGVSNSTDEDNEVLKGFSLPELVSDAPVKIISTTISAKEYLIYATNTRSRQIGLFAYDKATGEFKGTHYLGSSNPFEVASIINTTDGGIAVVGTTYVAGRFPRICLFKLSAEQLSDTFK